MVEHQPSKLRVASSNLVARSKCKDDVGMMKDEERRDRVGKLTDDEP